MVSILLLGINAYQSDYIVCRQHAALGVSNLGKRMDSIFLAILDIPWLFGETVTESAASNDLEEPSAALCLTTFFLLETPSVDPQRTGNVWKRLGLV